MRKDVRAGTAIGGILIAVIIVFAVVTSRGPKKTNQVVIDNGKTSSAGDNPGGTDRPPASDAPSIGQSDSSVGPPHDGVSDSSNSTPPVTPAHSDDSTPATPVADKGATKSNWGALLSADHVEQLMPLHTKTPDSARPVSPDMGDIASPSHGGLDGVTSTPSTDTHARRPLDAGTTGQNGLSAARNYVIKSGDTFSSIALTAYGESKYYQQIAKANPKVNPSRLHPGATLVLPDKSQFAKHAASSGTPGDGSTDSGSARHTGPKTLAPVNTATEYRVQGSDNLYKISMKLYHSPNKVDAIYQLNKAQIGPDPAKLKLDMVLKLPESPSATASR